MGSAACCHLASRGVRVLGLDRFDVPNTMGSSHGLSRMIRTAYYEHPHYVPLLQRAFELWRELEQQSGRKFLHETGGLYMGTPDDPLIFGSMTAAQEHNLPHRLLSREELARDFPQFAVPADHVAMLEDQAGLLLPEEAIRAHAELAVGNGGEIHANEALTGWSSDRSGITATTEQGIYRARHAIFTSGAWTDKLVRDLGVDLRVTRQVLGWVHPPEPSSFELGTLPVWAIGHPDGSLHYGFPILPDGEGFKLAHHKPGALTDPDLLQRMPTLADEQEISAGLQQFIPSADAPIASIRICMYTNSPDHHFIIDRHPEYANVTLAYGFSGHGFKFASVIGAILADLSTRGETDLPAQFLSLKRFL
ncbi:MAG: N-methyl-L-tryptophan oxidase [Gemmatimonadaceae bacterium]|nr:N-methyl-L-tryptophan oxidase [Gemmatimonadaceae bacterium]